MKENFVAKAKPGTFNSVAPDMKLEQTCQSGIISKTCKKYFVTGSKLVYHQVFINIRETGLHHEMAQILY